MQSGIEIAVCCQHQLFKHILDKVRYDFFAAAGGGLEPTVRVADRDFGRLRVEVMEVPKVSSTELQTNQAPAAAN